MELRSTVLSLDAADLLRSGFLTTAAAILAANSIGMLADRFIAYGARSDQPSLSTGGKHDPKNAPAAGSSAPVLKRFLDRIAVWNVPHSYFLHFYIVSVTSSLLWFSQLAVKGPLFRAVTANLDERHLKSAMSPNQLILCWALLAIQGARRLYECITLTRPSASKMWIGHWLFGLGFYSAMGIAIWIEGTATLRSARISLDHAGFVAPSVKTLIFLPIFMIASGIQYDCHCYLSSLKKYTLPTHPAFASVVCPHYTAECAIYLALSFIAAPKGEIINKTVFSGFLLVVVNLGVSAGISKDWYARKFGAEAVQGKWKMIPWIY